MEVGARKPHFLGSGLLEVEEDYELWPSLNLEQVRNFKAQLCALS